ncbi:hypothetical protein QO034_22850 [Sedimentitalea sp. JM2-8]|uniref:Uncharacterized protein n=1 Tax=Sedimentitalea xiamensis TaxID=3050037 RepID=A0ABT7FLB4_9RHOB|nr:hypothetical protein [Sedimentitalea xiamensis]MDK3075897.1 hypothetical protein [Sedimentitalea xiamensis]
MAALAGISIAEYDETKELIETGGWETLDYDHVAYLAGYGPVAECIVDFGNRDDTTRMPMARVERQCQRAMK